MASAGSSTQSIGETRESNLGASQADDAANHEQAVESLSSGAATATPDDAPNHKQAVESLSSGAATATCTNAEMVARPLSIEQAGDVGGGDHARGLGRLPHDEPRDAPQAASASGGVADEHNVHEQSGAMPTSLFGSTSNDGPLHDPIIDCEP